MERSGVDLVLAVKSTFLADLINRYLACKLPGEYVDVLGEEINLFPSSSEDEVFFEYMASRFAVSTTVEQGMLRINVKLVWTLHPDREVVERMIHSPYELSLSELERFIHIKKCGLKVGGESNELLLFGIEFDGSAAVDWSRFRDSYTGTDLIADGDLYGLFINRDSLLALGPAIDSALDEVRRGDIHVRRVRVTRTWWSGGHIKLKGRASLDMGSWFCSEIDFWWYADLSLSLEDTVLRIIVKNIDWEIKAEEDRIQATICGLNPLLWDEILGLLIDGIQNIVTPLIDFSDFFPYVGRLNVSPPQITTEGVSLCGRGESGTSHIRLDCGDELILRHRVFLFGDDYVNRPAGVAALGWIRVYNDSDASAFICSISVKPNGIATGTGTFEIALGYSPAEDEWRTEYGNGERRFSVLPGAEIGPIAVRFVPTIMGTWDQTYHGTLTIEGWRKRHENGGRATYTDDLSLTVLVTAKYTAHWAAWYIRPEYAMIDKRTIAIDVIFDNNVKGVLSEAPWATELLPEGTFEYVDITTYDPSVGDFKVIDDNLATVAALTSLSDQEHLTVPLTPDKSYGLFIGLDERQRESLLQMGIPEDEISSRHTLVTCEKWVLIPRGKITTQNSICHVAFLADELFIAAGRDLFLYDIGDLSKPQVLLSKRMDETIHSFDVASGARTKSGKYFLACLTGSEISSWELLKDARGKHDICRTGEACNIEAIEKPLKVIAYRSLYVVASTDGLSLFDASDLDSVRRISNICTTAKICDVTIRCNLAFVGTTDGIEIIDIQDPKVPQPISTCDTAEAVRNLYARGTRLYVNQETAGTIVLDFRKPEALREVAEYQELYWKTRFIIGNDVSLSISKDKKCVTLFTKREMMADPAKLRSFPK